MIYLTVAVGILLVVVLTAPFFLGHGGLLAASASINSPSTLRSLKEAVLQRYIQDEAAHKAGSLSDLAWERRKAFLTNRYVDAARRLDFLEGLSREAKAEAAPEIVAPEGAKA